jgi:hypothetical protein
VAALKMKNAKELCRESRALRADARRLRRDARRGVRLSRRRLHTCLLASARMSRLTAVTRRSPWSDLEWEPTIAGDLDQVLVPL